jgi:hypothetical protein
MQSSERDHLRIKCNTVFTLDCGVTDAVSFLFQNNLSVFLYIQLKDYAMKPYGGVEV